MINWLLVGVFSNSAYLIYIHFSLKIRDNKKFIHSSTNNNTIRRNYLVFFLGTCVPFRFENV
ncbi:hypothetical protein C1646_254174 [Rhizophagus diaphanus]|nr:hypothetical protein C1646_254174 [Rhizophagus diaphanus] [Rhizophagus sp. MUCL 43196]